ncbi:MAG: site-specific integrase [Lachnospiraceae bacterium]|nr:site-specific integrase [Lachnospiraceae bacterium]
MNKIFSKNGVIGEELYNNLRYDISSKKIKRLCEKYLNGLYANGVSETLFSYIAALLLKTSGDKDLYDRYRGAICVRAKYFDNMLLWWDFEEKDTSYYAFFLLYWTGIRLGEMLALTLGDIDFDQKKLSITKSYQKIDGEELVTKPKTDKSNRIIELSDFVVEELCEYTDKLYGMTKKDRLFQISKGGLEKIIKRNAEKAGLRKIRVHDLRHSHASVLIENHIDIATISRRLGHEN